MAETRMNVRKDYILRTVAGEHMVIPVGGAALQLRGLICLSEGGRLLFERLQTGCTRDDLIQCLLDAYEVESTDAVCADVDAFLLQMQRLNMLEESTAEGAGRETDRKR